MVHFRMMVVLGSFCCMTGLAAAAGGDFKEPYRRGVEFNKKGEYAQAIEQYTRAIALKKDSAELYFVRGRAYRQNGQFDQAIADLSKAIALKPAYGEAYNNRGVAYIGKGDKVKAQADFKKACELGEKDGCDNVGKLKEKK
jgi:Flp pilus assembly protein TadD